MTPSLQNLAAKSIARNIHANELENLVKHLPFNITRQIIRRTPASQIAHSAAATAVGKRAAALETLMRRLVRRRMAIMKHMEGRVPRRAGQRYGNRGRLSNQLWQNQQTAIQRARMTSRQKAAQAWWRYMTQPTDAKWNRFIFWHTRHGGRANISKKNAFSMYN